MNRLSAVAACVLLCAAAETLTINTMDDFWALRDRMDTETSGVLTLDVDLKTNIDFSAAQKQLDKPMGTKGDGSCTLYSGTFNGNNHKVVGMKMSRTNAEEQAGLFCGVANATLKDLTFDPICSVVGGAMAAMLSVTGRGVVTLENIHNKGSVTAADAAGIVGKFSGTTLKVSRCSNTGTITGNEKASWIGGVVSTAEGSSAVFEKCTNKGTITAKNWNKSVHLGGIASAVNSESSKLTECTNEGNMVVEKEKKLVFVGGIVCTVGMATNAEIAGCSNKGALSLDTDEFVLAGGVLGYVRVHTGKITITDCFNAGKITVSGAGDGVASGIVAQYYTQKSGTLVVSKCNNTAAIQKLKADVSLATGIVGMANISNTQPVQITDCMNLGTIESSNEACGIAYGTENALKITNSGNTGKVGGGKNASGISNLVAEADNVASTGAVTGKTATTALWKSCPKGKCTKNYQSQDSSDKETFIAKKKDCFYTSKDDKHVHKLLNERKVSMKYSLFWDTSLVLDFTGTRPSEECKSGTTQAVPLLAVTLLVACLWAF